MFTRLCSCNCLKSNTFECHCQRCPVDCFSERYQVGRASDMGKVDSLREKYFEWHRLQKWNIFWFVFSFLTGPSFTWKRTTRNNHCLFKAFLGWRKWPRTVSISRALCMAFTHITLTASTTTGHTLRRLQGLGKRFYKIYKLSLRLRIFRKSRVILWPYPN